MTVGLVEKDTATVTNRLEEVVTLFLDRTRLQDMGVALGDDVLEFGELGHGADERRIEHGVERVADRLQSQPDERLVEIGDASAVERVQSLSQGCSLSAWSSRQSSRTRIGRREARGESLVTQVSGAMEMLEAANSFAISDEGRVVERVARSRRAAGPGEGSGGLVGEGGGEMDRAAGFAIVIVEDDDGAAIAEAVGVGVDILVDFAVLFPEIVEQEVAALGEELALTQQAARSRADGAATRPSLGVSL